MSDLHLPRIGYVRITVKGKPLSGEGKQTDSAHLAKDGWIAIYDFEYKLYARDVSSEAGVAQTLAQSDVVFHKEAFGNCTIDCLTTLSSGTKLDKVEVHLMQKSEGKGEEKTRITWEFTDGSLAEHSQENRPHVEDAVGAIGRAGDAIKHALKGDSHSALEKVKLTGATVHFLQEVQGKNQLKVAAGYDFSERKYID